MFIGNMISTSQQDIAISFHLLSVYMYVLELIKKWKWCLIEVTLSRRGGHQTLGSHDSVQGGHALGCVWVALNSVMGKPDLTQATLKQEKLSKHLLLNIQMSTLWSRSHDLNAV